MEAFGAVGSVVGIISLGIQLARILQTQVDATRGADDRLVQIVVEIRATASGLASLQDLLLRDDKSADDKTFNEAGRTEIKHIVNRCNIVFRNVVTLVAKAGKAVLASIDEFQRKVQRKASTKPEQTIILEIELSNVEHLMWPWRQAKIEQYIADLDRLKGSLLLLLAVADLAKSKKITASSTDSPTWCGTDEESLLVDELYYKERGYRKAEKKFDRISGLVTAPQHGVLETSKVAEDVALELVQNWPEMPDGGGVASVADLLELGIVLEAYAIEVDGREYHHNKIPTNMRTLHEKATHMHRKNPQSMVKVFAALSMNQQACIIALLNRLSQEDHFVVPLRGTLRKNQLDHPTLLALEVHKLRRERLKDVLKSFTCLYGPAKPRPSLFIVIARFRGPDPTQAPLMSGRNPHPWFASQRPLSPAKYIPPPPRRMRPRRGYSDDSDSDSYRIPHHAHRIHRREPSPRYYERSRRRRGSYTDSDDEYEREWGREREMEGKKEVIFEREAPRSTRHRSSTLHDPPQVIINNRDWPSHRAPRPLVTPIVDQRPYGRRSTHAIPNQHRVEARGHFERATRGSYEDEDVEMSSDDEILPTKEEKISVARDYLVLWTTALDQVRDRVREKMRNYTDEQMPLERVHRTVAISERREMPHESQPAEQNVPSRSPPVFYPSGNAFPPPPPPPAQSTRTWPDPGSANGTAVEPTLPLPSRTNALVPWQPNPFDLFRGADSDGIRVRPVPPPVSQEEVVRTEGVAPEGRDEDWDSIRRSTRRQDTVDSMWSARVESVASSDSSMTDQDL